MSRWDHKLPISRLSWLEAAVSTQSALVLNHTHLPHGAMGVSGETGRAFGRVVAAPFIHPQMQGALHKRRGLKQQKCNLSQFSRLDV